MKADVEKYKEKTIDWLIVLNSMRDDPRFKSIRNWIENEIGETQMLSNLLKTMEQGDD